MNADIRVYPDKEMKAIDMAEIVDSVQLENGIIQGCGVSIIQNALHIDSGRILIHGRLGVVTAGNIELPELEAATTCYLAAVCDLAVQNPFYISLLTGADKSTLDQKKSQIADFNAGNGVDYVVLGTAFVDPATSIVSNWKPQNADPISNTAAVGKMQNTVNDLSNKIGSTVMGTSATTVTAAVKELSGKINTTNTNISNLATRATNLEDKTSSLISCNTFNISANSRDYKQLVPLGMYLVMINAASTSNALRGMYMVGVATNSALGIKAISAATSVTVEDGGNGLLKITNGSSVTLRLTLIRVY